MSLFVKLFNTTAEYNAYTADTFNFILPNVSVAKDNLGITHYNPWFNETRVVAKLNVTSTSSPTRIVYSSSTSGFSAIEIDGVEQPSVVSAYTFSTTGEHIVKYTLTDPTTIDNFQNCYNITDIKIPDSVTSIGDGAFFNCYGLKSVNIPSGVINIDDNAFRECSGLTSITIPNSVTSIGDYAFYKCIRLTSIEIPDSVTRIGNGVFDSCSGLTSITIPNSVTSIDDGAFQYCSGLTSIVIPSGVTSIGDSAFRDCSGIKSIVSNAMTAPTIKFDTFQNVKASGTLTVPSGSAGYNVWMGTGNYYLGKYNWTKVEQ